MPINMAEYMAKRRATRRARLIGLLGGRCSHDGCEVTESLEFDHIDPATRGFRISGPALDKPWAVLLAEVEKCQVLCRPHHWEKTLANGETTAVEHGGGLSGKKNCPCRPCKDRKAEYMQNYGHPSRVAQSWQ